MKSHKRKRPAAEGKSAAPAGGAGKYLIWAVILLGIVVLVVMEYRPRQTAPSAPDSPKVSSATTGSTNSAAAAAADLQKLKGKWLRPDGGYVIEIKSVESNGKLEAGYFNPQPIHVARAEASREGGATRVIIELQDVNYPGSTYTLVYVPERDLLAGIYYQALQQQSYEVYFERTQ